MKYPDSSNSNPSLPGSPEGTPEASSSVAVSAADAENLTSTVGQSTDRTVELRGTRRRSKLSTHREPTALRSKITLPRPSQGGNGSYVKQLLLTSLPLVVTDVAVLVASTLLASLLGFSWLNAADSTSVASVWLPPAISAFLLLNAIGGLYPGVCLGLVDEIRRLSLSITVVALVTASGLRMSSPLFWDRTLFIVVAYTLCVVAAPIVRSMVRRRLAKTSWWGFPALVCGDDSTAFGVYEWLSANRRLGLRPLGVVANPANLELDGDSPWFLGDWSKARSLAEENHAYWSVLVESASSDQDVTSVVEQHLNNVPHIFVVSELTGIPDHWNRHQLDEGLPGFRVEQHLLLPVPQLIKRGTDVLIATLAGILLSPFFLALGIAIKLTSPGPIFFGHERVGKDNTRFRAWKFRTMVEGAEEMIEQYLLEHPELREEWEQDHKLKNDPRVTTLGKFMRKWSIDELPQIWNVLCGEMSVVGPRPIVPNEIETYGRHFESFCTVLPGMTGLWQVCGRNNTTFDVRIQLGMYYIHHWSLWLDFYLIAKTARTVLFTKGAY